MNDTESCAESAHTRREHLSALMDGELEADAADRCCAQWREIADARSSWHAYHVIGDVLRSQELAGDAGRDARLLSAVRSRLVTEPVILAPGGGRTAGPGQAAVAVPARAAPRQPRRWLAAASLAIGAAAVAGLTVLRQDVPASGASAAATLALLPVQRSAVPTIAAAGGNPAQAATAPVQVADGELLRDAQLDRYLAAHKQFGGSSALGVPSGFLRSATLQAPAR